MGFFYRLRCGAKSMASEGSSKGTDGERPCSDGAGCGQRVVDVRLKREAGPRRQLHPIGLEECCGHWGATKGSGTGTGQGGDGY